MGLGEIPAVTARLQPGGGSVGGWVGFSLSCWVRRTGRWAPVAGRLTVAHGKKALSQEFPPSQVDGEPWALEAYRAGHRVGNRGGGSPIRSRTRPLGALPTSVCCATGRMSERGQAGLATLRRGGQLLGQAVCPNLTGMGLCPQGVPACPQEWGILQQPRWSYPPGPPSSQYLPPSPGQRWHQSTLSTGLSSVWTGPSGCLGSGTGTSNKPPTSSGGSKPAPGWLPASVRL